MIRIQNDSDSTITTIMMMSEWTKESLSRNHHIEKKQYGDRLVQDAEAQALRDLLSAALVEMEIAADSLIGEPQITKFEKNDNGIDVEVIIATRPAIILGDYAAMVPDVEKPAIDDAAVMARIEELASAHLSILQDL